MARPPVRTSRDGAAGRLVTDRFTITVPADAELRSVPTLVLGGIGSRIDLAYEQMDDLQLAVLSLLDAVEGEQASIDVAVDDHDLSVTVGPLAPGSGENRGLARVLSRLVDDVEAVSRDGAEWLTIRLTRSGSAAGGSS